MNKFSQFISTVLWNRPFEKGQIKLQKKQPNCSIVWRKRKKVSETKTVSQKLRKHSDRLRRRYWVRNLFEVEFEFEIFDWKSKYELENLYRNLVKIEKKKSESTSLIICPPCKDAIMKEGNNPTFFLVNLYMKIVL